MHRLILVATLVATVAACAPQRWVKPGTTDAEAQRAYAECDYQVNLATNGQANTLVNWERQAQLVRQCMNLKGFYAQRGGN